ncbi:MAG: hypothetical protein R6U46_11365 [Marinilabilia sp.]
MRIGAFAKLMMLFAVVVAFSGCQDDDIAVTTDAENDGRQLELAGPAGEITYEMSDLIEEIDSEYILVREDGLITASYDQEVDIDWETLVLLRDISETWYFSPYDLMSSSQLKATETFEYTEKVKLNHRDDVRYDSLTMNGGTLEAEISIPEGTTGDVTFTIPEVTEEGEPLQYHFNADEFNRVFQINEDLESKFVEFSQGEDSSYVTVDITFEVDNVGIGDVVVDFSLTDMQPGLTFGYFGQQEASREQEELSFDVFEELDILDGIEFADFDVNIDITSTIGVPFEVQTENIEFYHENGESAGELVVDGNNYVNMSLPSATYGDSIEEVTEGFRINRDNSNIVDLGNSYPAKMVFDVTSFSNPEGDTGDQNFMGPGNELIGNMNISIPAWFRTSNYSRQDTIDFDFNDMLGDSDEDARDVEMFKAYFDFYNKLPVGISVTAKVIDAGGNELDVLFDGDVVSAGKPDDSGYVSEEEHTELEVSLTSNQINQYLDENAMNIILEMDIGTAGDDFIKVYEDMFFRAVASFEMSGEVQ